MSPAEISQSYITICTIMTCTAAVVTIILNIIKAAKTPGESRDRSQDQRITTLEAQIKDVQGYVDNNNRRIKEIEEGNRVTQKAILALMANAISGDNMDELKEAHNNLQKYLVER